MIKILFLGETYRADAKSWIKGIEMEAGVKLDTMEIEKSESRWKRLYFAFIFFFKILNSRRQKAYDIVLAERATSYGFFSMLANGKLRVVAQQGITDAYPETGFSGYYKRKIQRFVYKNSDIIHAWGHVMTFAMLSSGAAPFKIMVLPKGIDLGIYTIPNKRPSSTSLVVTRSLYKLYQHAEIIQSIAVLKERGYHVHAKMVGDGPELENLERLSKELGVEDQLLFTGRISNEKLPEILGESALYVAFPTTEGVSSSLFEAMAMGCFPIVSDLPANQAFISNKRNGLLVGVGDVNALADSIQFAIDHPELLEKAVASNRLYIESKVDFNKNMSRIYAHYKKILAEKTKVECVE